MNYLLDTCTISDFFKKNSAVIRKFASILPEQIYVSTISVMEIEYGLRLNSARENKIRPLWVSLLKCIQVIAYSNSCAKETAAARADLKTAGQLIGPYDILIAGTALAHNMIVVTSNLDEFNRIPGLLVEDWRAA